MMIFTLLSGRYSLFDTCNSFAVLMMVFPDYAPVFYPDNKKEAIVVQQKNIQTLDLHVQGLTCSVCDDHLENAVYKVPGVINAKTDFHTGAAVVKYDKSMTSAKNWKNTCAMKALSYCRISGQ